MSKVLTCAARSPFRVTYVGSQVWLPQDVGVGSPLHGHGVSIRAELKLGAAG